MTLTTHGNSFQCAFFTTLPNVLDGILINLVSDESENVATSIVVGNRHVEKFQSPFTQLQNQHMLYEHFNKHSESGVSTLV